MTFTLHCHRPPALSSSSALPFPHPLHETPSVTVSCFVIPLLCHRSTKIVSLLYHPPSRSHRPHALSSSPCCVVVFPLYHSFPFLSSSICSVIIPSLCHRRLALSPSPCSTIRLPDLIVPMLFRRRLAVSLSSRFILVSLFSHRSFALSSMADIDGLLCHRLHALSSFSLSLIHI